MNKKILVWIFAVILLASFVTAAPPFVQEGKFTEGLEIKFPPFGVFGINANRVLNFHVFNISNGVPMTDQHGVVCYFHLYNDTEIYVTSQNKTDATSVDFEFFISGGNFSEYGPHAYIVQCNTTTLGGFDSVEFIVGNTVESLTEANSIMYLGLLFMVLFFMIASLYFAIVLDGNDKIEFGEVIEISAKKHAKTFLYFISYLFFILLTYLIWSISKTYLFGISPWMFKTMFYIAWIGVFPMFFFVMVKVMVDAIKNKELLNISQRGLKIRGMNGGGKL